MIPKTIEPKFKCKSCGCTTMVEVTNGVVPCYEIVGTVGEDIEYGEMYNEGEVDYLSYECKQCGDDVVNTEGEQADLEDVIEMIRSKKEITTKGALASVFRSF